MTLPRRTIGSTTMRVTELGFGAAPVGNFRYPLGDAEARDTIVAALEAGIDYFDTAPYYGFGLSERRLGDALRGVSGYVLSTKVGRLLKPDATVRSDDERFGFRSAMPFEPVYDYSYDGVMRSWEASLQRLGLPRIDILLVHDIGRRNHGERHDSMWEQLTEGGGFRALNELRATRAIEAFGLGVNEIPICLEAMAQTHLDVILLAGRYTLLEQGALEVLLPTCARTHTSIVVGGPFNSGILVTGTRGMGPLHYDYGLAPAAIVERVRAIEAVCDEHRVPMVAAALQFPLAHPQVASVIPGVAGRSQLDWALTHYRTRIPAAFWEHLKSLNLMRADAPVPTALPS